MFTWQWEYWTNTFHSSGSLHFPKNLKNQNFIRHQEIILLLKIYWQFSAFWEKIWTSKGKQHIKILEASNKYLYFQIPCTDKCKLLLIKMYLVSNGQTPLSLQRVISFEIQIAEVNWLILFWLVIFLLKLMMGI